MELKKACHIVDELLGDDVASEAGKLSPEQFAAINQILFVLENQNLQGNGEQ